MTDVTMYLVIDYRPVIFLYQNICTIDIFKKKNSKNFGLADSYSIEFSCALLFKKHVVGSLILKEESE